MRVQTKKESKMKKNGRKRNVNTKEYETKELLSRFAPYYKPHMGTLCMDLFCAALTTICELVLPLIMRYITNEGIRDLAALSVKTILMLGALYLVLRIIDGIANYYMAYTGHVMGAKIETGMRKDAYAHLQKLSDTYYNNTKVGQIMGRITNDLFDVTEFAHHCPEEFFIAAIKGIAGFAILAMINLWLTLIIFVIVPVMVLSCMKLNRKMKKAFAAQRYQIGELNARIEDTLLGQKVVKAFTNEDMENQKVARNKAPIIIGKYNWIANKTVIKKNTKIPDYTIVASSNTLLSKDYTENGEFCVLGGIPAKVIAKGIRRIYNYKAEAEINDYFKHNPDCKYLQLDLPQESLEKYCIDNALHF